MKSLLAMRVVSRVWVAEAAAGLLEAARGHREKLLAPF